ncbi:MAG TPA: YtxH domain-containing protein, partial [Tetragenococcus sp.]|nr:YtxH domain-containing protein [Tetragenococcus sp.]
MSQGFIKGILFGATAGSLGGLLLAPQSGQKTQEK